MTDHAPVDPAANTVVCKNGNMCLRLMNPSNPEGMPPSLESKLHPHPLEKMQCPYANGGYGCDVCKKSGSGLVYHCEPCGYDAHPCCALHDCADALRSWTHTEDNSFCNMRENPKFSKFCKKKFEIGEQGHRCDGCDYDLCAPCFNAIIERRPVSGHGKHTFPDGSKYVGEWEQGLPHGKGSINETDVLSYEGDFVGGKFHGKGLRKFVDGSSYEGDWDGSKRHGKGVITYADGGSYEGDLVEDNLHGKGLRKFGKGASYEGDYVKSKMHGKGVYTFANGSTYEGEMFEGNFHGKGLRKFANGSSYEGDWVNDQRTGQGVLKCPDGSSYEGAFVNDKMHGQGKSISASGIVTEGIWDQGNSPDVAIQLAQLQDLQKQMAELAASAGSQSANSEEQSNSSMQDFVTETVHEALEKTLPCILLFLVPFVTCDLYYGFLSDPCLLVPTIGVPGITLKDTLLVRGFFSIANFLLMWILIRKRMIIKLQSLIDAMNIFMLIWTIVTAIAVLNNNIWEACSYSTGKYQQVAIIIWLIGSFGQAYQLLSRFQQRREAAKMQQALSRLGMA